jgi:hypothetical protein
VAAASTGAVGQDELGCRMTPATVGTYQSPCFNSKAASGYTLTFYYDPSVIHDSYSWALSGPYSSVVSGCTAASPGCTVLIAGSGRDFEVSATVAATRGGVTATSSTTAYIVTFCGAAPC